MELKRVEIFGFKSFPEKVVVAFDKGITAIVGPNGSGKSNIADAVRWVLGEQSARTLRGSKMEDVIFAGTARRKALSYAEVTLVLDNSDRKMGIDYDEVAIRRRLFRSGESEYAVNDARCRLKDIQEMLMDTGIGKDGYSMIGQGQIDRILNSKPQDRRAIFEEASGITKFRTRKEQAEKQLLEEEQQLLRVQDILAELVSREDNLKNQAEKAEEYLKLKEELKLYEVSAFIGEYEQLKAQYDRVDGQMADLKKQIEESSKEQAKVREEQEEISQGSNEERENLQKENDALRSLMLDKEKAEGDVRVMESALEHHEREVDSLNLRLTESGRAITEREDKMEKEAEKIRSFDHDIEEKELALLDAGDAVKEVLEEQKEAGRRLADARKDEQEAISELTRLKVEAERRKAKVEQDKLLSENYESEKLRLEAEILEASEKKDVAEAKILEKRVREQEVTSLQDDLKKKIASSDEAIRKIKEKQEKDLLQMKDMQRRIQWLNSMQQEYEGFSAPVKAVMKQKAVYGDKIHGTVSDIISIEKKYVAACEQLFGPNVQNIVVADNQCAKALVEYLRKNDIGRATFLPVASVTGRDNPKNTAVAEMDGFIGYAVDIVKTQPIYASIMDRLIGNAVIAEDFDSARTISQRYGQHLRVVTLDGDIFNIGGSITGGANKKLTSGLLSRKGEIDQVKKTLNNLRAGADDVQKELTRTMNEKFSYTGELAKAEKEFRELTSQMNACLQEKAQAEFIESQAKMRLEELTEGHLERSEKGEKHEEAAGRVTRELEAQTKAAEEKKAVSLQKEAELNELQAKFMKAREAQNALAVEIAGIREQKKFMESSMKWEETEIEKLRAEIEKILEEKKEIFEKEKENEARTQEIRDKVLQAEEKIRLSTEKVALLENKVRETDDKRAELARRMEDVLNRKNQLEKEEVRMESQIARAQRELDDLQERMWNEYEMTYGSALELARTGFGDNEELKEAAALSKTKRHQNIQRLRSAIRGLGDVNVGAIGEYKALKERVEFLTNQRDDIVKSEENLRDIIERMVIRMEKQFAEGFESIAQSFNKVFVELFGGGQGLLKLTEGEDKLEAGVEINVQPPGKKLQSMTLLSGGERALTAIALLFAIQQLNPAPFCILDEIEAALDDANVDRYADFLEDMSKETQFIIITHRKGTMNAANTMYGVTMEEKGISKCVSVRFETDV